MPSSSGVYGVKTCQDKACQQNPDELYFIHLSSQHLLVRYAEMTLKWFSGAKYQCKYPVIVETCLLLDSAILWIVRKMFWYFSLHAKPRPILQYRTHTACRSKLEFPTETSSVSNDATSNTLWGGVGKLSNANLFKPQPRCGRLNPYNPG